MNTANNVTSSFFIVYPSNFFHFSLSIQRICILSIYYFNISHFSMVYCCIKNKNHFTFNTFVKYYSLLFRSKCV